jgi:hypothetical protein
VAADAPEGGEAWRELRLAERFTFAEPPSIHVNGDAGKLWDLSTSGCQVLSQSALKPNQTLKIQLKQGRHPLNCTAKVVWTRLEPGSAGQLMTYRAGVKFTKADVPALEAFVAQHKTGS